MTGPSSGIGEQLFLAEIVPELAEVELSVAESLLDVGCIPQRTGLDGAAPDPSGP